MLVTSSFSSAATYYPIYLLSQFHRLSLRTTAAVQDVKKDLMSLLSNYIFVSCQYGTQNFADFITKVNLTNGFPVSMALSEMAFMLCFTQHKDFYVKFLKLGQTVFFRSGTQIEGGKLGEKIKNISFKNVSVADINKTYTEGNKKINFTLMN